MSLDEVSELLYRHSGRAATPGLAQAMSPWNLSMPWQEYRQVLYGLRELRYQLRGKQDIPKNIVASVGYIINAIVEGVVSDGSIARQNGYIKPMQFEKFIHWVNDISTLFAMAVSDIDERIYEDIFRACVAEFPGPDNA